MGQHENIDSGPSYEAIFYGDASETSSNDATVAETGILNYRYDPFCSIGKGELMIVDYTPHGLSLSQNVNFDQKERLGEILNMSATNKTPRQQCHFNLLAT